MAVQFHDVWQARHVWGLAFRTCSWVSFYWSVTCKLGVLILVYEGQGQKIAIQWFNWNSIEGALYSFWLNLDLREDIWSESSRCPLPECQVYYCIDTGHENTGWLQGHRATYTSRCPFEPTVTALLTEFLGMTASIQHWYIINIWASTSYKFSFTTGLNPPGPPPDSWIAQTVSTITLYQMHCTPTCITLTVLCRYGDAPILPRLIETNILVPILLCFALRTILWITRLAYMHVDPSMHQIEGFCRSKSFKHLYFYSNRAYLLPRGMLLGMALLGSWLSHLTALCLCR